MEYWSGGVAERKRWALSGEAGRAREERKEWDARLPLPRRQPNMLFARC